MNKLIKKARHGFTLVEIMIVVLIIGILLAIAIPNFIRARESSRAKACQSNLKQIESAKEQWAMDTKAAANATPDLATDLVGATLYIKKDPTCPNSGTYTANALDADPDCDIGDNNGVVGDFDDHILP